ncbi:transcriptional regulator MelR [Dongshaea marina]|uniref:transcriptional regulator MelR n=1 Tax=Dongshaea marina TaxID=2047966 RepID=UPI000D3EA48E|nr:transcriptional regulator MelR [Dongshaea marina]
MKQQDDALMMTPPQDDSAANISVSPLSLYSTHEQIDIELRAPHEMPAYHWHGQVEINLPIGGDVEYIVNGNRVSIRAGHIGLFWACVPHRLTDPGCSHNMGIINVPVHQFLGWPLSRELVNQITHGAVLQSNSANLVSEFELKRWKLELQHPCESRRLLARDEISLMLKRVCLDGWSQMLGGGSDKPIKQGASRHSQFYVGQMLEFIAAHHDTPLTMTQIAEHVGLHANYAMGIFRKVMQMTIKQYITSMRINHARALLSDTERGIMDIALTVGFNSSSRFYQTFQRYLGMPPNQYRMLLREEHN